MLIDTGLAKHVPPPYTVHVHVHVGWIETSSTLLLAQPCAQTDCALLRLRKAKKKARRYKKPITAARLRMRERRSLSANAEGGERGGVGGEGGG